MRLLVLASLASATTSAGVPPTQSPVASASEAVRMLPGGRVDRRECRDRFQVTPADARTPPRPRILTDLPRGDTILAVYKEVDGCMEPVVVRYGDGRGAEPALPTGSEPPRHR